MEAFETGLAFVITLLLYFLCKRTFARWYEEYLQAQQRSPAVKNGTADSCDSEENEKEDPKKRDPLEKKDREKQDQKKEGKEQDDG